MRGEVFIINDVRCNRACRYIRSHTLMRIIQYAHDCIKCQYNNRVYMSSFAITSPLKINCKTACLSNPRNSQQLILKLELDSIRNTLVAFLILLRMKNMIVRTNGKSLSNYDSRDSLYIRGV